MKSSKLYLLCICFIMAVHSKTIYALGCKALFSSGLNRVIQSVKKKPDLTREELREARELLNEEVEKLGRQMVILRARYNMSTQSIEQNRQLIDTWPTSFEKVTFYRILVDNKIQHYKVSRELKKMEKSYNKLLHEKKHLDHLLVSRTTNNNSNDNDW